ncbi:ty3-gypsy retrotransposon protein [Tanacetum coccineum]|uniref:Ty3-gypsy retrotransposon protein n=1 Tax=Tanacetum coccineum TaxID=301880 RepID=A0ABQ5BBQ4_9ASTR
MINMVRVKEMQTYMDDTSGTWKPLLSEFEDVFAIPTTLPPQRTHDHKIPLKEGTQPINIRPYRHPPTQKDAIKVMVKELLESGVIRHSQSSFASPIVMVKKKYGSWRMCIDYRQLNKQTIKDKFPIPIIEELIDELNGAVIFLKLDLRSGYHQIRMYEDDIAKTAFKTHEGHCEFLVMPFGLTNAPSTFQALMNEVFGPFLRKFTLVFFDDILVYSPSMKTPEDHLRMILQTMRTHKLYAKQSKCIFRANHVEYLGHIITDKGVATDPSKVEAMVQWPVPTTIKQLKGFLGLTGYYRRFIRDYALISQPLTALLKKNAFKWSQSAQGALEELKKAMMYATNGHPIAFMSKTLAPKHQSLSTYEKEFLAVIQALDKWRGYLLDRHFIIKTDHFSLKYLMDQRFTTPAQMKWLPKLLGFDYDIMYKKGAENAEACALSRLINTPELLQSTASTLTSDHNIWSANQLLRKGKLVVGNDNQLRQEILRFVHEGSQVCQRFKPKSVPYPGLLQPLPIPDQVWIEISMDFIDGLPMSKGRTVLMVIVDKLSKYGHFVPLTHPYTDVSVAQAFLDNVYKLYGLPKIISDGQTEVVNRCVECYLRCMTGDKPKEWVHWVPLAEYWYNTSFHTSINTTPFQVLYGQAPPVHVAYTSGDSTNDAVDRSLTTRENAIQLLKFHLKRAQERMKTMADRHITERVFGIRELVLLKLQPYRQSTLRQHKHHKLAPKYYGPFKILERIGSVAYKLDLPANSQIHPVFHVSQIKRFKGDSPQVPSMLPQCDSQGLIEKTPFAILDRRMAKKGNAAAVYVLVQWINGSPADVVGFYNLINHINYHEYAAE